MHQGLEGRMHTAQLVTLQSQVFTICTTSLTFSNSTFCPHSECVLCGSQNKQRLFPYTAMTSFYNLDIVFTARYELGLLTVTQVTLSLQNVKEIRPINKTPDIVQLMLHNLLLLIQYNAVP